MLKFADDLDARFAALADPTRRGIVDRLSGGPASVSELAQPFPITLAAVVQHVGVLEACGLVSTQKSGRVRTCRLEPAALADVEGWLRERRLFWTTRLDRLEALLQAESDPGPTSQPQARRPGQPHDPPPHGVPPHDATPRDPPPPEAHSGPHPRTPTP